jgi:hypothetical protein
MLAILRRSIETIVSGRIAAAASADARRRVVRSGGPVWAEVPLLPRCGRLDT